MTKKQMEQLGFYNERFNVWYHSMSDLTIRVPDIKKTSLPDLVSIIAEAAFNNGIERGKRDKAAEVRKILMVEDCSCRNTPV